jgi:hypothetical protein
MGSLHGSPMTLHVFEWIDDGPLIVDRQSADQRGRGRQSFWQKLHLECRASTKYLRQSRVQHPDAFRIRGSFRVSQDRLVTNARKLRASWYLSGEVTALRTTRTAPNLAQALS